MVCQLNKHTRLLYSTPKNTADIEVVNSSSYLFEIYIVLAASAVQYIAAKAGITKDTLPKKETPICHFESFEIKSGASFPGEPSSDCWTVANYVFEKWCNFRVS